VSPVREEVGFYIPEDDILHSHGRQTLKSCAFSCSARAISCSGVYSLQFISLLVRDLPSLSPFPSRSTTHQQFRSPYVYPSPEYGHINPPVVRHHVYGGSASKHTHISLTRSCALIGPDSVRFEVCTAVTMKNGVFWVVTPCSSCKNRRFGGTWRLLHQGERNR
jgi:hypothetical protein